MRISRRSFLQSTAAGGVALTVVSSSGCGNDVEAAPLTGAQVDDATGSPTYGLVQLNVAQYPQLGVVGGALTLQLQPLAADANRGYTLPPGGTILVVQYQSGQFVALQSSCPHAGCPLGYSAKEGQVECPCHSSRFRAAADPNDAATCNGQLLHAPARSSLLSWQSSYAADILTIDLKSPLGCAGSFPAVTDGKITLPLSTFTELATAGQSLTGQPIGLSFPIIVARVSDSEAVTVASTCTHQGCQINFDSGKKDFPCPCHGSVFALDGSVVTGPAATPVKSFATAITADAIVITIQ